MSKRAAIGLALSATIALGGCERKPVEDHVLAAETTELVRVCYYDQKIIKIGAAYYYDTSNWVEEHPLVKIAAGTRLDDICRSKKE